MTSYYPTPAYPAPAGDPYAPYPPREWDREYRGGGAYGGGGHYDEYRGRARSRSPDDRGRGRRRSMSPYSRGEDRYETRGSRYDDYGRHSPPRSYGGYDRRGPGPTDPFTGDFPVSFKHYCDWMRYTSPDVEAEIRDEIEKEPVVEGQTEDRGRRAWTKRYEAYKKEHLQVVTRRVFNFHKASSWFIERYDPSPEYVSQRARIRLEGWTGKPEAFLHDLEEGKWDPEVTLEPPAAPEEAAEHKHGNGVKDENEDVAMESEHPAKAEGEDLVSPMKEEAGEEKPDAAETNGAVDRRPKDVKARIPPELSVDVQPDGNQLLIRTIPPALPRAKIEEVCKGVDGFVYLALGDPQPKKSFYRPGWVKYTDEADMAGAVAHFSSQRIDGFTMHVVHNTQPYPSRVRVAPPISNKPERMRHDLQNIKDLAVILEGEWDATKRKVREDRKEVKKKAAEAAAAAKQEGDVVMDEDIQKNENVRVEEDLDVADEEPFRGIEQVEKRFEILVQQLRDKAHEKAGDGEIDQEELENAELRLELDLWLNYLRGAFNTCYYCALVCDYVEALQRKCVKHIRMPYVKPTVMEEEAEKEGLKKRGPADDRWIEWLDARVMLLLKKPDVDPADYGGINYDAEVHRLVMPHVQQEDEGKFRCRVCTKLFKASNFVEKHVANKHPELLKEQLDIIPFLNDFALDPVHLTPQQHTSAFTQPPRRDNRQEQKDDRAMPLRPEDGRGHYIGGYPGAAYGGSFATPAQWGEQPNFDPRRSPVYEMGGAAPGFPLLAAEGLPAKPTGALDMGRNMGLQPRRGGAPPMRRSPPPNAKEDPRARAGRKISYNDMDSVAEGDVELQY
ncbi:hypothetical protein DACRYDRAFT_19390 [Dacryopinax primogenitus]|uniref:C2H2-type domain-containing protein n=1 Tax=Dacryopinax primogenitus (strain DJM 731) TaxID=1858805 RepID=M5GC59_DACPD|nr:uncharacterized protein DACRYDRAFT_19390 [Dacryopinax primogenitus]EJU06075.1 hypothetical protein DACRYDRAFT_19390 [Dacryopinax primogenitus]